MANRTTFSFSQKQGFEALIGVLRGEACPYDVDEVVSFLNHKIAQIDKRADAPRKLTPAQEANEVIKHGILENMEVGKRYTIKEMLTSFDCFDSETSVQKVSQLLRQLGTVGTGEIVRTEEKGKAYFSLA